MSEIHEIKLTNGNIIHYKIVNGIAYHEETNEIIVNVLEHVRHSRERIIVDYGDVKTGKSWGDSYDITGYIGRSTGTIKIPLLVYNRRSYGGGALLDHCIIKISLSKGKKVLYQHPNYNK